MKIVSSVLVGLGVWLVVDGVFSIIKYPRQTLPEQTIRVIRAIVGIVIILISISEN